MESRYNLVIIVINDSIIRSVVRIMWPRKRPSRHADRSRGATRFIPHGILSRKTVLREYLRTKHQNLPSKGMGREESEELSPDMYRSCARREQRQMYRGIPEKLNCSSRVPRWDAFAAGSCEICSFLLRQFDPADEIAL